MDAKALTAGAAGVAAVCYCAAAATTADESAVVLGGVTTTNNSAPLAGPAADVRSYDSAVVDYVLDRIITTNDGGTATLDSSPCDGVRVIKLQPAADGPFTPWQRDMKSDPGGSGPRGAADWYVPWGAGPAPADAARGRLLFLHGGGYTWYAPQDDVYRSFGTRLAQESGMAVLSIDYRLAPEHPFPAGLHDADAALRWLATNGPDGPDSPAATPPRLFVAGDSAGGGLAAALALRTLAETGPECPTITGQVLISPWLDLTGSGASAASEKFDPVTGKGDPIFLNNEDPTAADGNKIRGWALPYIGAKEKPRAEQDRLGHQVGASPVFASAELLRATLPPTLIQVGESELLRSDSTSFYASCVAAGVADVELEVWPRMWHCFHEYVEGAGVADGDTTTTPEPLMEALVGNHTSNLNLSLSLSVCLSACLPVCVCVSLSISLSLSVCLSVCLS